MSYGKTASLAALLAACCLAAPGARAAPLDPTTPVTPIKRPALPLPPIVIDRCALNFDPLFEAASKGNWVGVTAVFNDGRNNAVTYLEGRLDPTAHGNLFGQAQQLGSKQYDRLQPFDVKQARTANVSITPEGKISITWVSTGGGVVDYKPTCNSDKTVVISYATYTGVVSFSWFRRPG